MSRVILDVFFLVVCVNLEPKTAISRGEQNRDGWRRRILLTARLIKFYGGLRLMKSTAAYGGLRRRLGALSTAVHYKAARDAGRDASVTFAIGNDMTLA